MRLPWDHKARYKYCLDDIPEGSRVLDIACGVGYGSKIISQAQGVHVTGVDISKESIEYAKSHFDADNVEFICSSAEDFVSQSEYDYIISFETIEHIKNDEGFIKRLFSMLRPGGVFACSTPNEVQLPYNPSRFPFHFRHYAPEELDKILRKAGYSEIQYLAQTLNVEGIKPGTHGHFTVALARK